MGHSEGHHKPASRIERWAEDFLVRFAAGIGMGVLFIVVTPLFLGALNAWWFVAAAAVGFVIGFVGGDRFGSMSRRRRPIRK